jgi:lipoprotein-anchoring transpeptidase ErfK/SrfK
LLEFMVTGGTGAARSVSTPSPRPAAASAPSRQLAALAPATSPAIEGQPSAEFQRREVDYSGEQRPGTIVIDTPRKFLFLVLPNGRALRYGIGVGRPGFEWSGVKMISRKAEWPDWTPPPEMLLRRPELPAHMEGGAANPLGARALYLGSSMYRIHGTNEPWTIGKNVSSGCIRMMNEDVMDLYERVKVGADVMVL